jgi:hypothetical protein
MHPTGGQSTKAVVFCLRTNIIILPIFSQRIQRIQWQTNRSSGTAGTRSGGAGSQHSEVPVKDWQNTLHG